MYKTVLVPIILSAVIFALYLSVDAFPSFHPSPDAKSMVLKSGLLCLALYFATIRIQYGLFAFFAAVAAIHLLHFKDDLYSTKMQETFHSHMRSVIDALNRKESPAIETIPKIIVQTGPNKVDPKFAPYMDAMQTQNPDYQYLFFNDDDIDNFFLSNYPEYYTTYQRLPIFIQKIDFFRYLAIYHYGGFYFDLDMKLLQPLDEAICNHHLVFPVDEYIHSTMCKNARYAPICDTGLNILLGQYAFASVPRHPFIKLLIDTIHANVDMYIKQYRMTTDREVYVYRTTGPDFVTYLYTQYAAKHQVYILANGKRQMFGDYARHDFFGSWK